MVPKARSTILSLTRPCRPRGSTGQSWPAMPRFEPSEFTHMLVGFASRTVIPVSTNHLGNTSRARSPFAAGWRRRKSRAPHAPISSAFAAAPQSRTIAHTPHPVCPVSIGAVCCFTRPEQYPTLRSLLPPLTLPSTPTSTPSAASRPLLFFTPRRCLFVLLSIIYVAG